MINFNEFKTEGIHPITAQHWVKLEYTAQVGEWSFVLVASGSTFENSRRMLWQVAAVHVSLDESGRLPEGWWNDKSIKSVKLLTRGSWNVAVAKCNAFVSNGFSK